MKYVLASVAFLVFIVIGTWMVAVPEDLIINLISSSLGSSMQVEFSGFKKSLFYGFSTDRISVKKKEEPLIAVEGFSGHVDILALLRLKLPFTFSGGIGDGRISGTADLLGKVREISISADGINTGEIPFFDLIGIKGSGRLTGRLAMKNSRGDIQFDIKDTHFVSGTFGSIAIPLNDFRTAQGAMEVRGPGIKVKSFTMEGPGIYARIKGDITNGKMDLMLELMPEKSFYDKNLVFSLLAKYMVSPGFYSVPLTNQLNF